jgi:hypothetical protein
VRLRRYDNTLYPWLKARENVASQGNRFPLWIDLEGSGHDRLEVPMAAAALIVNALDGFLSLADVRQE